MKKYIAVLITAVIPVLILLGCNEKPIVIGYVGGLTGSNSELGVNGMYGASLAVDEINSSGGIRGRKIELIIKDDKSNKDIALRADQEMAEAGCIAIIGHMTSSMAETAIPYINKEKILMISPTMAISSLSDKDDFFLRLIPTTKQQAAGIAEEIAAEEIEDVLIIYSNENNAFADCLKENLSTLLGESNMKSQELKKSKFSSSSDYSEIALMIQSSEVEGVVIIASADIVSNLAQVMHNMGIDKKVFLPAWSMTNDLLSRGGTSVEGFYGVSFIDYESNSKRYLEFKRKYTDKYGDEPTFSSILSYESVMVLGEAIKETSSVEAEVLKKAIINKSKFKGLQSEFTINRFGDADREIFMYQIQDNQFNRVND